MPRLQESVQDETEERVGWWYLDIGARVGVYEGCVETGHGYGSGHQLASLS